MIDTEKQLSAKIIGKPMPGFEMFAAATINIRLQPSSGRLFQRRPPKNQPPLWPRAALDSTDRSSTPGGRRPLSSLLWWLVDVVTVVFFLLLLLLLLLLMLMLMLLMLMSSLLFFSCCCC